MTKLRAVIFVPPVRNWGHWQRVCIDHCDKHGYVVAAMVVGETADWEHVERLIASGLVEVVVVGKGSHLPPDRTPRIEVVDG